MKGPHSHLDDRVFLEHSSSTGVKIKLFHSWDGLEVPGTKSKSVWVDFETVVAALWLVWVKDYHTVQARSLWPSLTHVSKLRTSANVARCFWISVVNIFHQIVTCSVRICGVCSFVWLRSFLFCVLCFFAFGSASTCSFNWTTSKCPQYSSTVYFWFLVLLPSFKPVPCSN